jgi:hypothetical protein
VAVAASALEADPRGLETYPAAPRVRRLFGAAIDVAIGCVFLIPVVAMPLWLGPFMRTGLRVKILRFLPALYLLLRDSIGGRSPGKAVMGLVTYDRNLKQPGNIVDSIVRNWPFMLAIVPWVGWILSGLFTAIVAVQILLGRAQRMGDGFATTQVIDDKWLRSN